MTTRPTPSQLAGCLLGAAVGDALGLPYEGLSPRRARRMLGPPTRYRFCFGRGMVSDDTEQTCLVAEAWLAAQGDHEQFTRDFARRLRWWFAALPGGIGKATVIACVKLWLDFDPSCSGAFSAGNGAAMRAPLLGLLARDREELVELVSASTCVTRRHPLAEQGALLVAYAAERAVQGEHVIAEDFLEEARELLRDEKAGEMLTALRQAVASLGAHRSTLDFVTAQGWRRGVSGYVLHTVPAAIHAWLANQGDYRAAVTEVILAGGDTDSTAAIVGGIVGASVGREGIPSEWLADLRDWPCSVRSIEALAKQLDMASDRTAFPRPHSWPWGAMILRNSVFVPLVLAHGFRRLLPPY